MKSYWGVEHGVEVSKRQGDNSFYERMPRQARGAIKGAAVGGGAALIPFGLYGAGAGAALGAGVGAGVSHHNKQKGRPEKRWRKPRKNVSKAALPTKWNGMMQGIPAAQRSAGAKFNLGFNSPNARRAGAPTTQRSAQGPSWSTPRKRQLRATPALPTRNSGRNLDWNRMRG